MKNIIAIAFTIWTSIAFSQAKFQNNPDSLKQQVNIPIHQLRIYEVPKANQQAFNERFKEHAHRIMKKYGFTIVAMWESECNNKLEFIYLLEWKDENAMKTSWNNFMADQEWKDIKAQTSKMYGTFVDRIEDRTLILTNYSPQRELIKKRE
jgi:heme-degrading monooxygenase HmoA